MAKLTALDIASQYARAIMARDEDRVHSLRSESCVTDFVHLDAFQASPISAREATDFFRSIFKAFPDLDYEVTRTIAAEEVVVTEWVLTGTNKGRLEPPAFHGLASQEPTGKAVRLRGASVYDVGDELIQRETIYYDHATMAVELGVDL